MLSKLPSSRLVNRDRMENIPTAEELLHDSVCYIQVSPTVVVAIVRILGLAERTYIP